MLTYEKLGLVRRRLLAGEGDGRALDKVVLRQADLELVRAGYEVDEPHDLHLGQGHPVDGACDELVGAAVGDRDLPPPTQLSYRLATSNLKRIQIESKAELQLDLAAA